MPVAAPEVDLIDLRDDPPPGPSSSTTLVATRPAVKTKQTAPAKTTSTTYEKTGTKPAKSASLCSCSLGRLLTCQGTSADGQGECSSSRRKKR